METGESDNRPKPSKKYLPTKEAAEYLGITEWQLMQLKGAEIRGFSDRGTYKFRNDNLVELAGRITNADVEVPEIRTNNSVSDSVADVREGVGDTLSGSNDLDNKPGLGSESIFDEENEEPSLNDSSVEPVEGEGKYFMLNDSSIDLFEDDDDHESGSGSESVLYDEGDEEISLNDSSIDLFEDDDASSSGSESIFDDDDDDEDEESELDIFDHEDGLQFDTYNNIPYSLSEGVIRELVIDGEIYGDEDGYSRLSLETYLAKAGAAELKLRGVTEDIINLLPDVRDGNYYVRSSYDDGGMFEIPTECIHALVENGKIDGNQDTYCAHNLDVCLSMIGANLISRHDEDEPIEAEPIENDALKRRLLKAERRSSESAEDIEEGIEDFKGKTKEKASRILDSVKEKLKKPYKDNVEVIDEQLISKEGGADQHSVLHKPVEWLRNGWDKLSGEWKLAIDTVGAAAAATLFSSYIAPYIGTAMKTGESVIPHSATVMAAVATTFIGSRVLWSGMKKRFSNDFENAVASTTGIESSTNSVEDAKKIINETQKMDDKELTVRENWGLRDVLHLLHKSELINAGNTSPGVNESHCGEQCFGRVVRLSDIAGMINSIGFENFKIMSCEQKEQSLATQIGRIRRKAILSTSERAEASQIAKSWQSIQEDKLDDNELKRLVDHLDIQKRGQKSYKEWREKLLIVAAEAGQEIQNEHRKRLTHLTTSTISGVPAGILLASGVSAPFSLGVSAGIAGIYAASRYGWRLYKRQGQLDRNDNFEDWKSQIGKDLGASAKFVGKSWEGIRSAAGKTRDAANRFRGGSTKGDDSNSNAYKEGEEPIPKSVTQIDIDTERHRYDILRQEYGELYKATVDKRGDPELMEMRERMSALKKRLTTLELTFKAQEEKSKQVPIYKKVAGWTLKNAGLPSLVGGATIFIVPGWKIGAALGGFWLTKNIYRSISDKITGNKPRK